MDLTFSEFNKAISILARDLINVPIRRIDDAILNSLNVMGPLCHSNSIALYLFDWDNKTAKIRNEWNQENLPFHNNALPARNLSLACSNGNDDIDCSFLLASFTQNIDTSKQTARCFPLKNEAGLLGACIFVFPNKTKRIAKRLLSVINIYSEMLTSVLERIDCEGKLIEKTASMQLLLDSTNDGIGMLNKFGDVISCNKEFARRFNKDPGEMAGRNIGRLLPKNKYGSLSKERISKICSVFDTKSPIVFEDSRDGLWFYNRSYPVYKDGRVIAAALFSTDITDHVELEKREKELLELIVKSEELMKKEAEYLEILDGSSEGSYVVDFVKGTARYSENWKWRLGLEAVTPEDLLNRFHEQMRPEDADQNLKIRFDLEKEKKSKLVRVLNVKDRDGKVMWVMVHGKLIYDDAGKLIKTYGAFFDISELKEMEIELLRQRNELAEKNRLITEFFVNISHEFRTPLSILMMKLEDLHSAEISALDTQCVRRTLSVMQSNIFRLTKLVGNLLDVTKIESGFETANYIPADILAVARELTDSVCEYALKAGISLNFSAKNSTLYTLVDKAKTERILLNLISNAIKNTPAGGTIDVSVYKKRNSVILSVTDNGIGIPAEKQSIIFDRFQQVNPSLTRASEGCGIGLSLTKALVHVLGGQIKVKSKPGTGSTFSVELPLKDGIMKQPSIVSEGLSLDKKVQIEMSDLNFN